MTEQRFIMIQNGNFHTVRDTVEEKPLGMFEFKDNQFPVYACFHNIIDLLNELNDENEKLKAQLYCPFDSICIQCKNEYLVQKEEYYISKCKKGHGQCSKVAVKYCDDFEIKELQE